MYTLVVVLSSIRNRRVLLERKLIMSYFWNWTLQMYEGQVKEQRNLATKDYLQRICVEIW